MFISAPEYIANHGGAGAGWVTGMYQDLLGRTPSSVELAYWVNRLNTGTSTFDVAFGFAASQEREGARVRGDYLTYLGRSATPVEVDYWVDQFLHHGETNEGVAAGFVGSQEYYSNRGHDNRSGWVRSAYHDVLFREAADADLNYW